MPAYRYYLLLIMLVPLAAGAGERAWEGALRDGSLITIDPATNKATRTLRGETAPLWDGVHQLDNGAVVIVRDGVVVRDETIIQGQREQARNRLDNACMQLVTKVCGPHNECQLYSSCDPARQLLAMEREERNNPWSGAPPESSTLCMEALGNEEFFSPCTRTDTARGNTDCEEVASRVCGTAGACAETEACRAARQMVDFERQDLFESPQTPSPASVQCRKLLRQPGDFFRVCGH